MQSLNVIDSPILFMCVVMALVILILLFFPFWLYCRNFMKAKQEGKSYFEVITKIFLLHFMAMLICLALCSIINLSFDQKGTRNFTPKYGTALFLGFFDLNGNFLTGHGKNANIMAYWNQMSKFVKGQMSGNNVSTNTVGGNLNRVIITCALTIPMLAFLMWFLLVIIPPACIIIPVFLAMRERRNGEHNDRTIIESICNIILMSVSLMLLAWLHLTIASMFVIGQLDVGEYDFWGEMQHIWEDILFGTYNGQNIDV